MTRRDSVIKLSASLILLTFFAVNCKGQEKTFSRAPLPAQIQTAKKVLIVNGGGSDRAYDLVYAEMKSWQRYQIVASPEEADLIMEISYGLENAGTHVWSSTNVYTGATQVHSAGIIYGYLVLAIFDAKTRIGLWTTKSYPRGARRQKNREKEFDKAVRSLVWSLRERLRGESSP